MQVSGWPLVRGSGSLPALLVKASVIRESGVERSDPSPGSETAQLDEWHLADNRRAMSIIRFLWGWAWTR